MTDKLNDKKQAILEKFKFVPVQRTLSHDSQKEHELDYHDEDHRHAHGVVASTSNGSTGQQNDDFPLRRTRTLTLSTHHQVFHEKRPCEEPEKYYSSSNDKTNSTSAITAPNSGDSGGGGNIRGKDKGGVKMSTLSILDQAQILKGTTINNSLGTNSPQKDPLSQKHHHQTSCTTAGSENAPISVKDTTVTATSRGTTSDSNNSKDYVTMIAPFALTSAGENWTRKRRGSYDEKVLGKGQKFLINVEETKRQLLAQEDTDGDFQITVHDGGPKSFSVGTANSGGFKKYEIRGHYMISNLLQELALAEQYGRKFIVLNEERLNENPLDRMTRLIKYHFWDALTRRIDADGLEIICADPKNRSEDQQYRIYIPYHDTFAYEYFKEVSRTRPHLNLDVVLLPEFITPQYVKSINSKPGILSLGLRKTFDVRHGSMVIRGTPFVVPGGRFNEMYGWDSYFEALGLLLDGRVELARGMVENFCYEIEHYGKILNANRSYYLTRSQPPFLTDMIIQVYEQLKMKVGKFMLQKEQQTETNSQNTTNAATDQEPTQQHQGYLITNYQVLEQWLAKSFRAALKELFSVWLSYPRLDQKTGLSKFCPEGLGIPTETEATHFLHILQPFAERYGVSCDEFLQKYNDEEIKEPELDEYFLHDRAVRESGHDTTYRFEKKCAHLATIDLNSLVYKYEKDFEYWIREHFKDDFLVRVRKGPYQEHWHDFLKWAYWIKNFKGDFSQEGKQYSFTDGTQKSEHDSCHDGDPFRGLWAKAILVSDDLMSTDNQQDFLKEQNSKQNNHGSSWHHIEGYFSYNECPSQDYFLISFHSKLFSQLLIYQQQQMNRYLWNEKEGLYFDYDCQEEEQSVYQSVTCFWALWCGVASQEQAKKLVSKSLNLFEVMGGLVSGTEESRGLISLDRPNRQWDYPYGWAPHQILAWKGLYEYGFYKESARVAYRWLFTIIKSFVDFNGVVPEKFDIVNLTHKVSVEYGNVGSDFKMVVTEGFGWMNASFIIGLTYLSTKMKKALGALVHPDDYFKYN